MGAVRERLLEDLNYLYPLSVHNIPEPDVLLTTYQEAIPRLTACDKTGTWSDDEIFLLLCKIQLNCFESGLYKLSSLVNHSCFPNCSKFGHGSCAPRTITLPPGAEESETSVWTEFVITRPVKAGEQIVINYTGIQERSWEDRNARFYHQHRVHLGDGKKSSSPFREECEKLIDVRLEALALLGDPDLPTTSGRPWKDAAQERTLIETLLDGIDAGKKYTDQELKAFQSPYAVSTADANMPTRGTQNGFLDDAVKVPADIANVRILLERDHPTNPQEGAGATEEMKDDERRSQQWRTAVELVDEKKCDDCIETTVEGQDKGEKAATIIDPLDLLEALETKARLLFGAKHLVLLRIKRTTLAQCMLSMEKHHNSPSGALHAAVKGVETALTPEFLSTVESLLGPQHCELATTYMDIHSMVEFLLCHPDVLKQVGEKFPHELGTFPKASKFSFNMKKKSEQIQNLYNFGEKE